MGIAVHNLSSSGEVETGATDLASAVRQAASGILGTTVQLADLVSRLCCCYCGRLHSHSESPVLKRAWMHRLYPL